MSAFTLQVSQSRYKMSDRPDRPENQAGRKSAPPLLQGTAAPRRTRISRSSANF